MKEIREDFAHYGKTYARVRDGWQLETLRKKPPQSWSEELTFRYLEVMDEKEGQKHDDDV